VKTSLLGYFGHERYKLLDRSTGAVFKSRDVIFKEGTTHLAKQPTSTIFTNNNDLFKHNNNETAMSKNDTTNRSEPNNIIPLTHRIAPRPLPSCDLYRTMENTEKNTIIPQHTEITITTNDEQPIMLRRSHRTLKPSARL